jgi:NADP-dependent 3-hydroxy acid dehydrogenase YdfG
MNAQRSTPSTVVITGASSGIGAATAARLARDGHHVVLAARRADRLESLVAGLRADGGSAEALTVDVVDREALRIAVDGIVQRRGGVDVLVANAGVMPLSRLDALLVDEWDRMIDVNVRGLLNSLAAVLPHFTAQGSGHVVTVASVGAHEVVPTSAVYSATKHAAWAISEGLRQESDPAIRVTTVSPGVTESELATHITDPSAAAGMVDYRRHAIPASAIADSIAYAIAAPAGVDVNEIVVRPTRQRPGLA